MRLRASSGELVRGRCRATNQCSYCARLAAVENSEALALDALAHSAPAVWCVLTTRSTDPDPATFYEARRQLVRAIKRRWPDAEYAALVEFTTGYGKRSGGARRPHWNLLLKGVPAEAVEQLSEVVRRVWCARVDARPAAQHIGLVAEAGGLMRYLALHFQKEDQSPPAGWSGHRFLHSRGYFAEGITTARERAREALQYRREVWKLNEAAGGLLTAEELHTFAVRSMEVRKALSWELVQVHELAGDDRRHQARRPLAAHSASRHRGSAAPPSRTAARPSPDDRTHGHPDVAQRRPRARAPATPP